MASQFLYLSYLTLNIYRTFCDPRSLDISGGLRRQTHFLKLIHIPAGLYAAIIRRPHQRAVYQVDHKLPCILNDPMRKTFLSHRNRYHGRIGTDRACPGYGDNIGSFSLPGAAHHHCGHRIKHIARLPVFFAHKNTVLSFTPALPASAPGSAASFWIPLPADVPEALSVLRTHPALYERPFPPAAALRFLRRSGLSIRLKYLSA